MGLILAKLQDEEAEAETEATIDESNDIEGRNDAIGVQYGLSSDEASQSVDGVALGDALPETDENIGIETVAGGIRDCLTISTEGHDKGLETDFEDEMLGVALTDMLGLAAVLLDTDGNSGTEREAGRIIDCLATSMEGQDKGLETDCAIDILDAELSDMLGPAAVLPETDGHISTDTAEDEVVDCIVTSIEGHDKRLETECDADIPGDELTDDLGLGVQFGLKLGSGLKMENRFDGELDDVVGGYINELRLGIE